MTLLWAQGKVAEAGGEAQVPSEAVSVCPRDRQFFPRHKGSGELPERSPALRGIHVTLLYCKSS